MQRSLAVVVGLSLLLCGGDLLAQQTDNAARFRETFIGLDANGDTVLERDEIPESGRPAFDRLLKRGDANKNGKLEVEELRALGQKLAVLNDPAAAMARFRGMDKDADGKVSRSEFTGIPVNFDRIDADKDGALSTDEITRFFSRMPAASARAKAKAKGKARAKETAKPPADTKSDTDASANKPQP